MKRLLRVTTGVFAAMLLVFMPLMTVSAQPADTGTVFTSQLTGDDISLGESGELIFQPDQYTFSTNDTFQEEYVWVWSTYSSYELILIDGPTDAQDYMDITLGNMETFYDSWELLGEESDLDISWFVGEGEIDGNILIVYFEYEVDVFGDVDFAYMQFSSDLDLFPDMQLAQQEMTVGGLSVPLNADMPAIADATGILFEGEEETVDTTTGTSRTSRTSGNTSESSDTNQGDTSGTTTTSRTSRTTGDSTDSDEDNTSDTTTSRTSRSSTSDDSNTTNLSETSGTLVGTPKRTSRSSETNVVTTPEVDETGGWGDLGLVGEDTWVSPTYETSVEWDVSLWEFPFEYDSAIIISPNGWDSLTLQTTDGLGYVFVTIEGVGESTPRSILEYWQSDDYLSGVGPDPVILDSARTRDSASIVYSTLNTADEEIVVILDASFQEDGTVVYTQLTAAPATIATVYANYVDGVQVDGGPLNLTWDVEDIAVLEP